MYRDGSGENVCGIADAWVLADDAMSISLQLRDDVLWHDGEQCTARNLVNMFDYTQDEALAEELPISPLGRLTAHVTEAEAVASRTWHASRTHRRVVLSWRRLMDIRRESAARIGE